MNFSLSRQCLLLEWLILVLNGENNCLFLEKRDLKRLLQVNYLRSYKFRLPKIGCFDGECRELSLFSRLKRWHISIIHYSRSLLILWFECLVWNIYTSGKNLNCASIKALNKARRFSKEGNLENIMTALIPY